MPASVSTEADLNFAINGYNQQTVTGTYQITIEADITLTSATVQINNSNTDVQLQINGSGNSILGAGSVRILSVAANAIWAAHPYEEPVIYIVPTLS